LRREDTQTNHENAELRVVGLMQRRPRALEDRDVVLLRNAEFQIMLCELRYPPIRYL